MAHLQLISTVIVLVGYSPALWLLPGAGRNPSGAHTELVEAGVRTLGPGRYFEGVVLVVGW